MITKIRQSKRGRAIMLSCFLLTLITIGSYSVTRGQKPLTKALMLKRPLKTSLSNHPPILEMEGLLATTALIRITNHPPPTNIILNPIPPHVQPIIYSTTNAASNPNWELLQSVDLIHWTVVPPSAYSVSNPYVWIQYQSNTISHVVAIRTNYYYHTLNVTNKTMIPTYYRIKTL